MTIAINSLTVDSRDPRVVAAFWSAALDWPILYDSADEVMIAPFDERKPGVFPVLFLKNPDDKRVKNRWHFDLAPEDQAAEVARLRVWARAAPTSVRARWTGSSWRTSRATSFAC